jgi:uncharacterized membrane protein YecN with MAPEG domain
MLVPITGLFGAINAVVNVALAANVSRVRATANVYLGTGDSEALLRATRQHGNNAEYVALGLVTFLLAELNGSSAWALYALGGVFTFSRLMHAAAVDKSPNLARGFGALLTWAVIAVAGVYAAVLGMR